MSKFDRDQAPKLITSRRAVAAGFMSIIATPALGYGRDDFAKKLEQLTDVPMTLSPMDFTDMMREGLFMPDYRHPMCRQVYADGTVTRWYHYQPNRIKQPVALEICAPDSNGAPRFAQLKIG